MAKKKNYTITSTFTVTELAKRIAFKARLKDLCNEYGFAPVPFGDGSPNAHDSLCIVKLNDFWKEYLEHTITDIES